MGTVKRKTKTIKLEQWKIDKIKRFLKEPEPLSFNGIAKVFALDYIKYLESTAPNWKDAKKNPPESGIEVLVYADGGYATAQVIGKNWETGEPEWTYTGLGRDPEYWMDLPEEPKRAD